MSVLKPTTPVWQSGHPLAAGYYGMWPLHEGTGTTATDLMPSGHNGAFQRDGGYPYPTWEDGTYGKQVAFTSDVIHRVNFGNICAFTTEDFALEVLFYPTSFATSPVVFGKGDWNTTSTTFLQCLTTGELRFYVKGTDNNWYYISFGTGGNVLAVNTWYHVVACKQLVGGQPKLQAYLNGSKVGGDATAPATLIVTTHSLQLGRSPPWSYPFNGKIAMAAVHGALTATNVATLYADPWGVVRPGIPVKLSSQRRFRL